MWGSLTPCWGCEIDRNCIVLLRFFLVVAVVIDPKTRSDQIDHDDEDEDDDEEDEDEDGFLRGKG